MREHKYRAWVIEDVLTGEGKMIHLPRLEVLMDCYKANSARIELNDADTFTYIEFTGLKDSKGVDIYEGDILTTNSTVPELQKVEVRFIDGAFCIGFDGAGKFSTTGIIPDDFSTIRDVMFSARNELKVLELEVIGNIYENPELLKC